MQNKSRRSLAVTFILARLLKRVTNDYRRCQKIFGAFFFRGADFFPKIFFDVCFNGRRVDRGFLDCLGRVIIKPKTPSGRGAKS